MIARRTFIKRASLAIASAAPGIFVGVSQAQQVPNSSGSEPAKLRPPRALATATTTSMTRSGLPCVPAGDPACAARGFAQTEANALIVGAVYDRPFFLDSTKYGRS